MLFLMEFLQGCHPFVFLLHECCVSVLLPLFFLFVF